MYKYLLISHVAPVHPVEQVHRNSLVGGAFDAWLFGWPISMLRTSTPGRCGLPIELMPCMPRTTTTGVVVWSTLLPSTATAAAAVVVVVDDGASFLLFCSNLTISCRSHNAKTAKTLKYHF